MEQRNYLGYEFIEKENSRNAKPDILSDAIIVGESGSGASFLLKEMVKNKDKVLFISDYQEELDDKFKYKEMNESFNDDFINLVLDFRNIENSKQFVEDYINQGYTVAINSKYNDKHYLNFLYSIGRLKNVIAVIHFADDLIENKLFPNEIILMKNEKSIYGKVLSSFQLGDYVHLRKKIYNEVFKENKGNYIDIEKKEGTGTNFNAILSNLGYCLSSTMNSDFYDKVFKIGIDLMSILSPKYDEKKLSKIFYSSVKNSKNIKCGCTKNCYDIDICHVKDLSKMIKSLSSYSVGGECLITKIFQKEHLIDFFTCYFTILERSDKYKSLLENPIKLIDKTLVL